MRVIFELNKKNMLESFFAICLLVIVFYFFSPFDVTVDEEDDF